MEFALGLAKTAVAGTVSTVKSAIEEEKKLRVSVQDDLVFITAEFEMMQSFLIASSAGDQASKNLVVRTWVRQLRALAFDVEDCAEFIVHLDKQSFWDWVRRLASPVRECFGRPPLPLDVAVGEIKRLKARVEETSQRNNRYNLITGDTSQAEAHHQLTPYAYTGMSKASSGTLQALLDVWKRSGRLGYHTAIDLRKLIDSDVREFQVISLWRVGSGDVGEDAPSSLREYANTMTEVYEDPVICQRFKNRAWVKLSALHPFNPVEFLNNLLNQFRSCHHHHEDDGHHDTDHENIANRRTISELRYLLNQLRSSHHHHEDDHHNHACADSTISEFLQKLSKLRYLVVLEHELNTIADWAAIRIYLPTGTKGSRVVVSTNSLRMALLCTGATYQVSELQRFSHNQGIYAFFPEGCGHRVISVFYDYGFDIEKIVGIFDVEFKHGVYLSAEAFDPVHFARGFIVGSFSRDQRESAAEDLKGISDDDITRWCSEIATESTCLVFVDRLQSTKDWDSIKKLLLCDSTRCRIVVFVYAIDEMTAPGLARHCVDNDESRAFNAKDLIQEQAGPVGDAGGLSRVAVTDVEKRRYDKELRARGFCGGATVGNPSDDEPGWIFSLWGIAGVGKTHLARILYKRYGGLYNRCSWVDVPYPFDLTELCRLLVLGFHSDDLGAMESAAVSMMEGQDPVQWCCKILRQYSCFLVLDGMRSTHDWDVVKAALPFTMEPTPQGGRRDGIVVITREESIATYCTQQREYTTWNVTGLSDADSLLLFKKIVFSHETFSRFGPEEQKIFKPLVYKCGGLPQVIAATARSLPMNPVTWAEELNSHFMSRLQTSPLFISLRGLFFWMQSYFNALPDELKPCIFYMLVFPANKTIRWRRVLRRWMAEGYLPGGPGSMEMGEKLLRELMKLSIICNDKQQQRTRSCKVNGFFREYIKSSPMEDNLVLALEDSCSTSSRITAQHLTIRESWERDSYKLNMMEVSRLRSLTVSGEWKSFLISRKMKVLRVLDLEGTNTELGASVTDDDLEKILKAFPRLKFLSLRGCIRITRLPDSLGEMRQLQTLDVKDTSIVKLPSSIIKLHKLQYIRAGTTTDRCTLLVQPKASTPPPSPPTPQPSPHPSTAPTPQEDGHADTNPCVQGAAAAAEYVVSTKEVWQRKAADLVESSRKNWWKLKNRNNLRSRRHLYQNGGGVEFVGAAAKGIGKLTHLHTLGVVNVAAGKGGLVLLKELKKLAQLRKLGLSGINRANWRKFCDAIRGKLHHLESLSLQLEKFEGSYEFACFDDRFQLPKSLQRLKVLYSRPTATEGRQVASIGPGWINKLPNLRKFNHELRISTQEDITVLTDTGLMPKVGGWCLRIKPTVEHLTFGGFFRIGKSIKQLSVECSSNSKVTFEEDFRLFHVSAISIHCCCSPSAGGTSTPASSPCGLEIAGLPNIRDLKQVTVTGTYADDLKRKFATQIEEVERRNS